MHLAKHLQLQSTRLAYSCIGLALLLLLGVSIWSAYQDARYLHATLLQGEVSRLRSHAERTVGRIEQELEQRGESNDLSSIDTIWLKQLWRKPNSPVEQRLYAALVDSQNQIVTHSDPSLSGGTLRRGWYERVVPEAGTRVVLTQCEALTDGRPAYDIRIPVMLNDREIGDYHVGFDVGWFERWAGDKRNQFLRQRSLFVGATLLIVLLATTSLFYIATHTTWLSKAINKSQFERAAEVGQIAAGLAHEIRNPMHAIRLNLHALARVDDQRRLKMSADDHTNLLAESNREIQRIELLLQELMGFANPEEAKTEVVDLISEVQSTLAFVNEEMIRQEIEMDTSFPSHRVFVRFDPNRLRQIVLNLLRNAEQALDGPGRIEISIIAKPHRVSLTIADNGPGVPEADRHRVFEPFFSTKKDGSGLGLALAKRYVTEAQGTIHCQENHPRGTVFRIEFPRLVRTKT